MKTYQAKSPGTAEFPQSNSRQHHIRLIDPVPATSAQRRFIDHLDIRIDRDGQWFYHGSLIQRKELVCLFSTALTRDENGGYWLVTPTEMGQITVEDAPFIAVEMYSAGCGCDQKISFQTNVEQIVTANSQHSLYIAPSPVNGKPAPYIQLSRRLSAKLSRSVYYELMERCVPNTKANDGSLGVWSEGEFFMLGSSEGES